jgi:regulator of sigma D
MALQDKKIMPPQRERFCDILMDYFKRGVMSIVAVPLLQTEGTADKGTSIWKYRLVQQKEHSSITNSTTA